MKFLLVIWLCAAAVAAPPLFRAQNVPGGGFLPSDLPDLALWLDADDASTLTLSGSVVDEWRDKSGNGRNFTGSGSARPTYTAGVVDFDSVDDGMVGSYSISSNPFTVVVLYRTTTTTSAARRTVQGGVSPNGNWLIGPYAGIYRYYDDRSFVANGPAISTNKVIQSITQYDASSPAASHWVNGALSGSASYGSPDQSLFPHNLCLGAAGLFAEPFGGEFYGLVVLAGMDDASRQLVEGWMAWKYGAQDQLDAGHPYKSTPP